MMEELEQPTLFERFDKLLSAEDTLEIRSFLNDQNISDVAALIDEYPEYAARIIAHMAVHRAVGVFKILDITQQKEIVKKLPYDCSVDIWALGILTYIMLCGKPPFKGKTKDEIFV